jgi:Na+-driven multidrug efflux pump
VSQIGLPLGICFVIQRTGTLQPMHIWLAILTGHATRFALSALRFTQGKWRGIAVNIGPAEAG